MEKTKLNEEVGKIREMMGLNEEMGAVQSQNPTGSARKQWDSGVARSGPGNPVVDNNASFSVRTTHGKGNPIELGEEEEKGVDIEDFSEKRMSGAEKIADSAKQKGGLSTLTYHHFEVKLPYYEKASKGELNMEDAKEEYDKLIEKLQSSTKDDMDIKQIEFQELVGKIEVLGELMIENK